MFTNWFKSGKKATNLTVLIVSDDAEASYFNQTTLVDEGCIVHVAATVTDALKLLDEQEMPDVLIGDFRFPAVDGRAFVEKARARFGKTTLPPMLFLMDSQDDESVAHILGVDDLLMKPCDRAALLSSVSKLTNSRRPSEAKV